jgi:hypothetical protein
MIIPSWRRRLPLLVFAVVVGAPCVSACSAGSPGLVVRTHPTSVAPPSPTALTPASPPAVPGSSAAVEAGVRDWVVGVDRAFASGDTRDLRAHTEKTCACLNLATHIESYWSGGAIRGLTWTLHRLYVLDVNYHMATVQLDIDETPYQVIRSGRLSATHKADRLTVLSQFALKNGVWRMWSYSQMSVEPR